MATVIQEAIFKLKLDDSDVKSGVGNVEKEIGGLANIGNKMTGFGTALSAAVTLPIIAIGTAAFKAGVAVDDAYDTIRVGTGATGDALKGLKDSFGTVFGNTASDAATVATAIADINTRLGLTGEPLESLSTQFVNFARITGTDVAGAIGSVSRVFGDWGTEVESQGDTFDFLFKTAQATGISVGALSDQLVQFGAPLRQMGFDMESAAVTLASFEREGVNANLVMGSLRIALGKFASEGVADIPAKLNEMVEGIKNAGSAGEANALAMETFGAKAGPDMAAAIREGRFEIGELLATIKDSPETINGVAMETEDFAETFVRLKNNVTLALAPLGQALMNVLDNLLKAMTPVIGVITSMGTWFANLSESSQTFVLVLGGIAAAIGPAMVVFGKIATVVGTIASGMAASGGAVAALKGALVVLTGPVGAVVASLGVLAALGVTLYNNWEAVSTWFQSTFPSAINAGKQAWNTLTQAFNTVWNAVKTIFNYWKDAFDANFGSGSGGQAFLLGVLAGAWQGFQTVLSGVFAFVDAALSSFVTIVSSAFGVIASVLGSIVSLLTGNFAGAWQGLKDAMGILWTGLVTLVINNVDLILGAVQTMFGWIPGADTLIGNLRTSLQNMIPAQDITTAAGAAETAVEGVTDEAGSAKTAIGEMGTEASPAAGQIVTAMGTAAAAVKTLGEQVAEIMANLGEKNEAGNRRLAFTMELTETTALKNEISNITSALTALADDTTISIDDQRVKDLQASLLLAKQRLDDVNKADIFKAGIEQAMNELATKTGNITANEVTALQNKINELGTQAKTSEDFRALVALQSSLDATNDLATSNADSLQAFFDLADDDLQKFAAMMAFEEIIDDINATMTGPDAVQAKIQAVWTAVGNGAMTLEDGTALVEGYNAELAAMAGNTNAFIEAAKNIVLTHFPSLNSAFNNGVAAVNSFKNAFTGENGKSALQNIGEGLGHVNDTLIFAKGAMREFGDAAGIALGALSYFAPEVGLVVTNVLSILKTLGLDVNKILKDAGDALLGLISIGGGGGGTSSGAIVNQILTGIGMSGQLNVPLGTTIFSAENLKSVFKDAKSFEDYIQKLVDFAAALGENFSAEQIKAAFTADQIAKIKQLGFPGLYDPDTGETAEVSPELKAKIMAMLAELQANPDLDPQDILDILKSSFGSTALKTLGIAQMLGLPPLAQGGILSGATMALMGEYAGAQTNPEVIAPLNKLKDLLVTPTIETIKSMMGSGMSQQVIYVTLDGRVLSQAVFEGLPDVVRMNTGGLQ
jgi:phage-related minor tail protein